MRRRKSMRIDAGDAERLLGGLPDADFVQARYDIDSQTETSTVLIILSTPRSGSTLLAHWLHTANLCVAHEYFQTDQYLPIFAVRWGCLSAGKLDRQAYINSLCRNRTCPSGWLGIKLHGAHLRMFADFESLLPKVEHRYVYLRRRELIEQAVSHEIASQTGRWSSHFESRAEPEYDFRAITRRARQLHEQNLTIEAFLRVRELAALNLDYEDLVSDPVTALQDILPANARIPADAKPATERLARPINSAWAERFARDYSRRRAFAYGRRWPRVRG